MTLSLAIIILTSPLLCNSLRLGRPQFTKPSAVVKETQIQFPDETTDLEVDLPKFVVDTNKFAIGFVKDILGVIYGDRHYARFAALETIARVPYFSCTCRSLIFRSFRYVLNFILSSANSVHPANFHRHIRPPLIRNLWMVQAKGIHQIALRRNLEWTSPFAHNGESRRIGKIRWQICSPTHCFLLLLACYRSIHDEPSDSVRPQ